MRVGYESVRSLSVMCAHAYRERRRETERERELLWSFAMVSCMCSV